MASAAPSSSSFPTSSPPTPPPLPLPITPDSGNSYPRHHRRRTRSFCSSSSATSVSSFSSFSSLSSGVSYLSSPLAPPSPSPSASPLSSIPFSWEDQPGVPKTTRASSDRKPTATKNKAPIQTYAEPASHRKITPTPPDRSSSRGCKSGLNSPHFYPPLRPPPLRACSEDRFGFAASFRWSRCLGLQLDPGYVRDPFTVALIQCSKHRTSEDHEDDEDHDEGYSDSASWKPNHPRDPATTTSSSHTQQRRPRRQTARKETNSGGAISGTKFYTSCKTSCAVVESAAVTIPRAAAARPGGTKSYDLLRRRTDVATS